MTLKTRDEVIDRVVKILRLARAAGTDAEAANALLLAQRLMYEHDIAEGDVTEGASGAGAIGESVVDESGHHIVWREYLAAVVAENFRCAYIISTAKSTGVVRLVFVGRHNDVLVATEAYQSAVAAAERLADAFAATRAGTDPAVARESFFTGFLKGLYDRLQTNVQTMALAVVTEAAVITHATALTNAGNADGGALGRTDGEAFAEGFQSGYAHGTERLPGG